MNLPRNDVVISRDPTTGAEIFRCPAATRSEVDAAVARAAVAQREWAARSVAERAVVLRRFAELVEVHGADLTALITREVGKLRAEAGGEVEWTALSARWYAEHPPEDERVGGAWVRQRPLGVVAAVTPWNVPLVTPAWKWLPALLGGNAVVWKPSPVATATAMRAAELMRMAGLASELLAVVPGGADVAAWLCDNPRISGVHFTGSTRAGRAIAGRVAPRFVRCALEMGGVNAAIVFDDADLELAARCIVESAVALGGQKCTAVRRVLVEDRVAERLLDALATRVHALVAGDPGEEATTLPPLISPGAVAHAERAVRDALGRGARVLARSPRVAAAGGVAASRYFRATVLVDLPEGDPLESREVFAPVISVQRFGSRDDAWRLAAANDYGLSAAVYTRDAALARQAADRLATGVVAINRRSDAVALEAPFGGRGQSGNGFAEGGVFAYRAVTDLQAVYGAADESGR